jgi:DNA repair protein RadC
MNKLRSEDVPSYGQTTCDTMEEDAVIDAAIYYLERRLRSPGEAMISPSAARNLLKLKLAELPHEVFACLWLDAQHRVIAYEEMFRGTLSQTSVYPREVLKSALKHNAAAVVFSHNHPSGVAEPSRADEMLTSELKNALAMIDVRVLDHIVVGGMATTSFAERGLI